LHTRPTTHHQGSQVQWVLETEEEILALGETMAVEFETQGENNKLGKFLVEEILHFWGQYAIISCHTLDDLAEDDEMDYQLFWVATACLHVPPEQAQQAFQVRMQQPLFSP
jgi:hypothetical protein